MDLKHGLGKKVYANGDVYEGLWRHGKAEGPGRYRWRNANEYDGQWLAGRMHGQGTLIWAKGVVCGRVCVCVCVWKPIPTQATFCAGSDLAA